MPFKDISYRSIGSPFIQWSETICAILVKGIMRNNSVTSGLGGNDVKRNFLSRALAAPLFDGANHLCNFGRRHHEELFYEIILKIWTSGSGEDAF